MMTSEQRLTTILGLATYSAVEEKNHQGSTIPAEAIDVETS